MADNLFSDKILRGFGAGRWRHGPARQPIHCRGHLSRSADNRLGHGISL